MTKAWSYEAILFLVTKKRYESRQDLHKIFLKLQYKCAEVPYPLFQRPLFLLPHLFRGYLTPPPPSQDQQNGKYSVNTTFVFQDWSQGCIFHISINSLRNYLSPECLLNILRNLYIPPWLGKIFKLMLFTFLENALNLGLFTHVLLSPHPPQEIPPIFIRKNKDDLEH